jgi:hypothetical protein
LTHASEFASLGSVCTERVSLRFSNRQPAIPATVEIDREHFDMEEPLSELRGRILEPAGFSVVSDWRIHQRGCHTMWFANDRHCYQFELLQQGGTWFRARLKLQHPGWADRIREALGF